jgi:hypothetical protein
VQNVFLRVQLQHHVEAQHRAHLHLAHAQDRARTYAWPGLAQGRAYGAR